MRSVGIGVGFGRGGRALSTLLRVCRETLNRAGVCTCATCGCRGGKAGSRTPRQWALSDEVAWRAGSSRCGQRVAKGLKRPSSGVGEGRKVVSHNPSLFSPYQVASLHYSRDPSSYSAVFLHDVVLEASRILIFRSSSSSGTVTASADTASPPVAWLGPMISRQALGPVGLLPARISRHGLFRLAWL